MNQKIKLFASRIGSIGDHLWLDGRDPDEEEAVEKFAKMIIDECATLANNSCQGSESHDEGTVFYYDADIGNKIKQHFGIE